MTELQKLRREAVCDALDKFPDMPSRTIARMLVKWHYPLFDSVDNARDCVTYVRGRHGDKNRKTLKSKKYVKPI